MTRSRCLTTLLLLPSLACAPQRAPAPYGPATAGETHGEIHGETHGAFDAASGVSRPAGSPGGGARVVPLAAMTGDVEILHGHPDSAGAFVMRILELPGAVVPPHAHPVDEHITVVSGTWWFGTGERFDSTRLRRIDAGGYAFAPAGTTMFAASPEGAVVQVHGVGPFHIRWRDGLRVLADSGGAPFRFRKGDAVTGARGAGRVRQGYASGAMIQYEIARADGTVYMANEDALHRP